VILAESELIDLPEIRRSTGQVGEKLELGYAGLTLREARKKFERDFITAKLIANAWNMNATAGELGIERTNLYRKIRELGIEQKDTPGPNP